MSIALRLDTRLFPLSFSWVVETPTQPHCIPRMRYIKRKNPSTRLGSLGAPPSSTLSASTAIRPTAYRERSILPCEEILLPLDHQRNNHRILFPERQIQSQLLRTRSVRGRASALNSG